jgi:hypothetical protein
VITWPRSPRAESRWVLSSTGWGVLEPMVAWDGGWGLGRATGVGVDGRSPREAELALGGVTQAMLVRWKPPGKGQPPLKTEEEGASSVPTRPPVMASRSHKAFAHLPNFLLAPQRSTP